MTQEELVDLTIEEVIENDFGYTEIKMSNGVRVIAKISCIVEGGEAVASEEAAAEEPASEEAGITVDDINKMTKKELKALVKENGLTSDVDLDTEELKVAICQELGLTEAAAEEPASEISAEDINGMDEDELKSLIADKDLAIDPDDYEDNIRGLRKKVIKTLEL